LLHVHGAEGGAAEVGLVRPGLHAAHAVVGDLAVHRAVAERARLVDALAHAAERGELTWSSDGRRAPVDQQGLEAIAADEDAKRPVAIRGLEVALPQIGWLQDVAVAVDDELGVGHARAPPRRDDSAPVEGAP